MVCNWKVLSFVANRAQMLSKMVSDPPLGLIDVEEATSGAADAVDHISGCAGEPLSDVEGFLVHPPIADVTINSTPTASSNPATSSTPNSSPKPCWVFTIPPDLHLTEDEM
eukprot:g25127.t1